MTTKPRPKLTKNQRFEVWKKYIGPNEATGPCFVCKETIHLYDFDVAHNVARSRGGTDNISNYRPTCRRCNNAMGTMSISTYKSKLRGPATRRKNKPTPRKSPSVKASPIKIGIPLGIGIAVFLLTGLAEMDGVLCLTLALASAVFSSPKVWNTISKLTASLEAKSKEGNNTVPTE